MKPGPKPWGEPAADPLFAEKGIGSNHHRARLNEILVCDIICDAQTGYYTYQEIAAAYGLKSEATISQLLSRYVWGHVETDDRQRWVAGFLKMGKQEPKG